MNSRRSFPRLAGYRDGMQAVSYVRRLAPRRVIPLVKKLLGEIKEDRLTGLAAEVAFFAVLSIFPGLLVIATGLGSLDSLVGSEFADEAKEVVEDFMNQMLTNDASQTITAVTNLFEQTRSGVLTISLVVAVYSLTRGFAALIRALNVVYDLTESRTWIRQRLVALGLALGSVIMTVIILAMFVAGPLLGGGRALADSFGAGEGFAVFWDWFRWPLSFLVLVAWATAVFHLGPNQTTAWARDLPGAILTSILWLIVSLGFSIYLRLAGEFNQVLGILGGALILLIWLYLLSAALLVGAELNSVLAKRISEAGGAGEISQPA